MAYQLKRPAQTNGMGGIHVYRAMAFGVAPQRLWPQGYVANLQSFRVLWQADDLGAAASALMGQVPFIELRKVVTEIAYERVRAEVAPQSVSRLTSLFCFADPVEAFSFTEETGEAKSVLRVAVPDDIPWTAVDMAAFGLVHPPSPTDEGWRHAYADGTRAAMDYWAAERSPAALRVAEVLVAGEVPVIEPPLGLISLLRSEGVVDP